MHDQSDAQLLRAYAEHAAEAAFAEIVARHTDLVYSAALRQVYSPDFAGDVTQSVFTDLARKARTVSANLSPEASLVGWLYRGTRFAARDLYRSETRRTQRERQAMAQLLSDSGTGVPPVWSDIASNLDDAMSELDDTDRDAVLLRYFKNHDLRTVGATLGISDDAAQKRVSRAVERLREFFAKRGVTVGASGLAVVISANAVQAAPVGLALTISAAAALTGTTLATTATVTANKAIAMTTLQKTSLIATLAVVVAIPLFIQHKALAKARGLQSGLLAKMSVVSIQTPTIPPTSDTDDRTRRDRDDLERLRRETATLRVRLSERSTQARRLAAANPSPKNPGISIGETLRLSDVRDAGQATPAALLQTQAWAILHGDTNRLAQLMALSPDTDMVKIQQMFEALSKEAMKGKNALLAEVTSSEIRLLADQPGENHDRWVVHEFVAKDGSIARRTRIRVRHTEAGWKLVIGINGQPEQETVE